MNDRKRRRITTLAAVVAWLLVAVSALFASWPQAGGGALDDAVLRQVTGPSGTTYALGTFRGIASFGSTTLTSFGSADLYVAKYDQGGNVLWAQGAGGGAIDRGFGLALDESENVYIAGYFHGTASFGAIQVTAQDPFADAFVAKLGNDGNWKWVRPIPGGGVGEAHGVAVSPGDDLTIPPTPGSVFVAGRYTCSARFEHPDPVDPTASIVVAELSIGSCSGGSDLFISRMDVDGKWIWAIDGGNGSSGNEWATLLTVNDIGRLLVGGELYSDTTIGGVSLAHTGDVAGTLWTETTEPPDSSVTSWQVVTSASQSGSQSWAIADRSGLTDRSLEMAADVTLPSGTSPVLELFHRFRFDEPGSCYDGGVVEYSTDSGGSWNDIGDRFIEGAYNGALNGYEDSPLGTRDAYCMTSSGYPAFGRVQVDLSDFIGGSIRLRFRFSAGTGVGDDGWWIDDIRIRAGGSLLFDDDVENSPNFFIGKVANTLSGTPSFSWVTKLDDDVTGMTDLEVDEGTKGHVLVSAKDETTWGGLTVTENDPAHWVVAQLSDGGTSLTWAWASEFLSDAAPGGGLALDESGDVYVGAHACCDAGGSMDVVVGKFEGAGGLLEWTSSEAGGEDDDLAFDVSYGAGSLYVGGSFHGSAVFGDEPIDAAGGADAFVANLDPESGDWFDTQTWFAGQEVDPPFGADVTSHSFNCQPEIFVDGSKVLDGIPRLFFWSYSGGAGKLSAVQPADNVEIRWKISGCDLIDPGRKVSIGRSAWPVATCPAQVGDVGYPACRQIHVAGSPVEAEIAGESLFPAPVKPDSNPSADAAINQGVFNATDPGKAVLIYIEGPQPDFLTYHAKLEVVETVHYLEAPLFTDNVACTLGEEIVPPAFHEEAGRSGYVVTDRSYFDGVGADAAYNRQARTGQIVAVNQVNPNLSDGNDLMVVAWYHRSDRGVFWPELPTGYECRWPAVTDKIIVASQLGSEVLGQVVLDPLQFPGLRIYNQPDPMQPGFNPNDEHAIQAPSNTGSGGEAIFSLRSDFALVRNHTAASEPYVIVKYTDPVSGKWAYRVYQVLATGAGFDDFRFAGTAGTPIYPPYPLSLLQGCQETLVAGQATIEEPVPPPFFKDYKSQVWGKSAGTGAVRYFYPLQPTFFYDLNDDQINDDLNGNGTFGDEDGQCIPFLARLPVAQGGTASTSLPINTGYELNWPVDLPVLTIGETLLEPKAGLPDIFNQAGVEVIYDEVQDTTQQAAIFDPTKTLVRLIDPLNPRAVKLGALPGDIATRLDFVTGKQVVSGNSDGTIKLPSQVRSRITYDEQNQKLAWSGVFDAAGAGEPMLLLNVMTDRERRQLKKLDGGNGSEQDGFPGTCQSVDDDCTWDQALEALYNLTRNPNGVDVSSSCYIEFFEFEIFGLTIRIPYQRCDQPGDGLPDRGLFIGLENQGSAVVSAPVVGFQPALTAGFAQGHGFVTLAFNNDPSLNPLPVSVNIIRVDCLRSPESCTGPDCDVLSTYQGEMDVIASDNVFDEQLTLRHSGDFAGRGDDVRFEWYYHPDIDGNPPEPLPDPEGGQLHGWLKFTPSEGDLGAHDISIEGANLLTLSDNWFVVRYEFPPAPGDDGVSGTGDDEPLCGSGYGLFTGQPGSTPTNPRAMLAEGWIKRVIKGLNPFETRVKDFHAAPTNTFASMLVQLGERYEGDIAFNPAPSNLNKIGMIEAYETVLNRGIKLSIGATPPVNYGPANNALLLVASRIADFYTLLGDEAFADAQDPMIALDTQSRLLGIPSLAPTIFNFENQLSSLLEEEVVLLRGRDDSQGPTAARPVYNRLFWNFTTGDGEIAYALSYDISDQNFDGIVDEFDAQILFPQGHGDALGHYLTSLTTYYKLLRHPFFTWVARPESIVVAGVPILVDFLDERKFAQAAANKARAGAQLVDLTYRLNYVEDPAGQWQGYKDTDPDRAWGLSGWARRAGQGAYFDWVVANSLLPDEDLDPNHVGIEKIDRKTVDDLHEITASFEEVQTQLDEADRGLNPLGLAKGVVPFDIDPSQVDGGNTHFEQVMSRAEQALDNTVAVWDFANALSRMLRFNQDSIEKMTENTRSSEINFKNRLIEIFGSPYDDDIGPGGTYPAGYTGPDLYHYQIVDAPALAGTDLDIADLAPEQIGRVREFQASYEPMANGVNWFNIDEPSLWDDFALCADLPFGAGCSLGRRPEGTLDVTYTTWQHPDYGIVFTKNRGWTGSRRSSGKIQDALNEVLRAQTAMTKAMVQYNNLLLDIESEAGTFRATFNVAQGGLVIKSIQRNTTFIADTLLNIGKTGLIVLKRIKEFTKKGFEGAEKCIPKNLVAGVASGGDVFAGVRCATIAASVPATGFLDVAGDIVQIAEIGVKQGKDEVANSTNLRLELLKHRLNLYNLKGKIDSMVRKEPVLRTEIYARQQAVQQSYQKYQNALAQGQRLMASLVTFRKKTAAAVQEHRYGDMAYRIFRNDALQKYRAQFDLAARYTYLAATAYDYETNLLHSNSQSGQGFLTDIVRERSIGQILGHSPVPGSRGLADPLGRMKVNFEVLKGQMGFNNPQVETNRFSLRRELFRIEDGDEADEQWRSLLQEGRVDNLWDVEEFRRFARPFAPEELGAQPGIVIPFTTTVTFGQNLFGWPLGAGDSFYDASNFATKIRGVGVWLDNFGALPLALTPRVYLFPTGADVLRAPAATDFATREWSVVDQLLPVPFPIGDGDLTDPNWIPLIDSLSGTFNEIRRFSSFRAYDYQIGLDLSEITSDSRLIGRSVWNTQWVLIIPGGTLLSDADEALDIFILGQEIPGGDGDRDGNGVRDIFFFFKTYAYSGF